MSAGDDGSSRAAESLEKLCRGYWYPLYAFVRRSGRDAHTAQDLTQAFFERLLEKRVLARADPQRGRFRSFLIANLKNFLANDWDRTLAQKRGGGQRMLSLDDSAEALYLREPATNLTPERIYDQRWATTLLDRALGRLEEESGAAGGSREFKLLKNFITTPPGAGGYDVAAAELGLSTGAVAAAVHRLRSRYRELVRAEVADTVASPGDVDDELRHLFAALQ